MESKKNSLNDRQGFDLVLWMKNNQVSLEAHKATVFRAAEMATADLGFVVTERNISHRLKMFPECRWKVRAKSSQRDNQLQQRVEALEKNLQTISTTLTTLHALYQKIDRRTPNNGRLFEVTR